MSGRGFSFQVRSIVILLVSLGAGFGATGTTAQCPFGTLIGGNSKEYDRLGLSVAMDGHWVVVGARGGDGRVPDSGAVYVYDRRSIPPLGATVERARITASDGEEGDAFSAVAVFNDRLVVGATGRDDFGASTGAAYVYRWTGSSWIEEAKLLAEDARRFSSFGSSVALDGQRILIGAGGDDERGPSAGAAYLFVRDAAGWTQATKLTASDGDSVDVFGGDVAMEGDYLIVGAPQNEVNGAEVGSAYVFHYEQGAWVEQARLGSEDLMDRDRFGSEVAISGDYIAVGAPGHDQPINSAGAVYVFQRQGTTWTKVAKLGSRPALFSGQFGSALSMRDNLLVVGTPGGSGGGSAFLFEREGGEFVQVNRLWTPGVFDWFGGAVALGAEHLVVGAPDADFGAGLWSGAGYVYRLGMEGPIDIRDFARFQTCHTGPGRYVLNDCCSLLDFDEDRDVDHDDFVVFAERFTGP